jgi:branched-chain amino acid aminotransferase
VESRIYVDGRITPPEEAVVPVLDRGFLYGDSVYEVLWWHRGVLVQRQDHFDRLRASGERTYLLVPFSDEELLRAVDETVAAAGVEADGDAYVRLIVTRGGGPLGLELSATPHPSLIVIVAPAHRPDADTFERGVRVAVGGRRRNPRLALDPRAKTGNYLNNVLALHEARLAGADEAIMLNERGDVAEATTANVYLVSEGRLVTPPLEAGILMGTTRSRILALCRSHGIEATEAIVPRDALHAADEIFLSSSVKGIRPVTSVDGEPVADGSPGPLTRRIRALFEAAADQEASSG